jgi:hypothetical protein
VAQQIQELFESAQLYAFNTRTMPSVVKKCLQQSEVTNHAFSSGTVHLDRRRGNGKFHQVDFECRGRHLRSGVAPQRIWFAPLSLPVARWIANAAKGTP